MNKNLLISIVTISYNDRDGLDKTIESVNKQDYENIEHIIIDGKSTDGTDELLHEKTIRGRWISEPDQGIYDAMNKGVKLCSGDFVLMLNASDVLNEVNTVSNAVNCIQSKGKYDAVYYGRVNVISDEIRYYYPPMSVDNSNIKVWISNSLPNHQAMFFPLSWYKINSYDIDLKIIADTEYKIRAKKYVDFVFVDEVIACFSYGGVSSDYSSFNHVLLILKETWKVNKKYYSNFTASRKVLKKVIKYIAFFWLGDKKVYKLIK